MKYKTCYSVHELQNQYKGNWPDPKDRQHVVWFHLPEMSRQGKSTEIGRYLWLPGAGSEWEMTLGISDHLGMMKLF